MLLDSKPKWDQRPISPPLCAWEIDDPFPIRLRVTQFTICTNTQISFPQTSYKGISRAWTGFRNILRTNEIITVKCNQDHPLISVNHVGMYLDVLFLRNTIAESEFKRSRFATTDQPAIRSIFSGYCPLHTAYASLVQSKVCMPSLVKLNR